MFNLPQSKLIKDRTELQNFSTHYGLASGLPVPIQFLQDSNNNVFGIYYKGDLIGGYILGNGPSFRTVEYFAKEEERENVCELLGDLSAYTEICCFWIEKSMRSNSKFNFFTWLAMTYSLKVYGNKYFLFGTCSRSLARLYGQTPKSVLIHRDRVNKKTTFIFRAKRRTCITGMFEIILHKLRRIISLSRRQPVVS